MPIQILMPALSPTMTEGTIARWLKSEGDAIAIGDVLAEIETDKATMEIESADEGVLGKILVPDGAEGIAVNTTIGVLLEEGEGAEALAGFKPSAAPAAATAPSVEPAPAVAAPTVYDMCKAIDRGIALGEIRLESKSGGKSGTWERPEATPAGE